MPLEHNQQVDELFHSALGREPSARSAYLGEACGGDEGLRREVESLLAAYEESGSLIEQPVAGAAAQLLANYQTRSLIGQRIGHYQIIELIGAGGMGEVYLAEDSSLGRRVAIKLLPALFTTDKERVRRLQREARAVSALNHPNILTIHEIGEVDSSHFIVTEFIDGITLRERVTDTRMDVTEALDVATQVASALAAAHEEGIVHRDIKPENIMLRRRDRIVKVLDFGLATLTEREALATADAEAAVMQKLTTHPGMVMGTVTYMSPEQASGLEVNARTDIWSLGCVLFEMVAGRVPFEGETASDVIAAIMEREPLVAQYLKEAPEELQWIITKALRKDCEERYQTAKEMLTDLRRLRQRLEFEAELERSVAPPDAKRESAAQTIRRGTTSTGEAEGARTTSGIEYIIGEIRRHNWGAAMVAALLIILLGGIGYGLYKFLIWTDVGAARFFNRSDQMTATSVASPPTAITFKRLTPDIYIYDSAISPDGRYLVYSKPEERKGSMWLMDIASGSAKQIMPPTTGGYYDFHFSLDGSQIYYTTNRQNVPNGIIARIPLTGGTPQEIAHNVTSPCTLSPDNQQLAFVRFGNLVIANTDGSGERVLASRENTAKTSWYESWGSQLSWSPDGRTIVVCGNRIEQGRKRVELLEISVSDGAERHIPVPDWDYLDDVQWLSDRSGLLVIARETSGSPFQIWHVAYPGGETSRITNGLQGYHRMSLSADSRLLVAWQEIGQVNIWAAPLADAKQAKQLTFGNAASDGSRGLAVFPDGRIVFTSPRGGNLDLWMMNADSNDQKQLTANAGENFRPSVSPDGRYIVFVSTRAGKDQVWRMDADGGNPKQLTDSDSRESNPSISADGQWVYFARSEGMGMIYRMSIDGGEPVRVSSYDKAGSPFASPDGKLIAYGHYEDTSPNPWKTGVMSAETGETVKLFDFWVGVGLKWTTDSKSLIYIPDFRGNLWQQPLDGSPPRQLTNLDAGQTYHFDISPDFKTLVMSRGSISREAVLISNFLPGDASRSGRAAQSN